ncbi:unnamed protein product [Gongylonema pulchrum]|uniref:Rab-GAP TBC domain-containing protein n=1 Tax=Gongylonema pulchrum TaxID=637853 RepID=A0A183DI16_9BILA|nr:unnamed protein product [Gongylonema pulchrum]
MKATKLFLKARKVLSEDYYRMKLQWKTISKDQESRFSEFAAKKALIEKDVSRTDRTHVFFGGSDNSNLTLLNDILMTYCMYNFDLGKYPYACVLVACPNKGRGRRAISLSALTVE